MAITAMDMQNASDSTLLKRAYIEDMRQASPIIDLLKWQTTGRLNVTAKRWLTLPSPAFRAANAAYSESTGRTTTIASSVYPLGKYSDVDKIYVRDKSVIENPRKTQDRMNAVAMTRVMLDRVFSGDGAVDPYGFDGLKVQLAAMGSTQRVNAGTIDISTSANRGTNGYAFLNLIDSLIDAVEGAPDALIMSRVTKRYFGDIARQKQLWRQDRDQLGRRVDMYGDIPILSAGYKVDDETEIIGPDFDGTTGRTSIFAVRFGDNEVSMLQEYPMEVIDHGLLQTIDKYRTEVDWPIGMMIMKKRSAARLYDIKVA